MQKLPLRFLSFNFFIVCILLPHYGITQNRQKTKQKTGIFARLTNLRKRYQKYRAYQCTPQEEHQLENELYVMGNITLATGIGFAFFYINGIPLYTNRVSPKESTPHPNPPLPQPLVTPVPENNLPPIPQAVASEEKKDPLLVASEEPMLKISAESESPPVVSKIELPTKQSSDASIQKRESPSKTDISSDINGDMLDKVKKEVSEFADKSKQKFDEVTSTLKNKFRRFKNNIT